MQVDYTGFSTINAQRFGQKFVGKVASPHDILLWHKAPVRKAKVQNLSDAIQKSSFLNIVKCCHRLLIPVAALLSATAVRHEALVLIEIEERRDFQVEVVQVQHRRA